MMKKLFAAVCAAAVTAEIAVNVCRASELPICDTSALTAGAGSYTNTRDYYAERLVSVEVFGIQASTNGATGVVSRVRSGRTNTVGSIVISSGAGIYRETNTTYLFRGDVLRYSGFGTNTGSAELTRTIVQ